MVTNPRSGRIGIIGGSGLQELLHLANGERKQVSTPFGDPSDSVLLGDLDDVPIAFLQRHGTGHRIAPSHINVRANIAALRSLGCKQLLSLSAVGSLQENCPPGSFVVVDQFIDRTFMREKSFFGHGLVAHVAFADPTCRRMNVLLSDCGRNLELPMIDRGTYVVMEGPQFSTRAESNLYRQWGATVIGMTAMPEAKLAREAEMCYALIAIPTDYDCWRVDHEPVTAHQVSQRMKDVVLKANMLIKSACKHLYGQESNCPAGCNHALDSAIMTHPDHRDTAMLARLAFLWPQSRFKSTSSHEMETPS